MPRTKNTRWMGASLLGASLVAACGARSSLLVPPEGSGGAGATIASSSSGSSSSSSTGTGSHCASLDVDAGAVVVTGANADGVQNVPAGVTPNASTILVQRGVCSSGLSLYIADETTPGSGVYQTQAVPAPPGVDVTFEETVTLKADGLTIIALTTAHDGFLVSTRSAVGQVDFGTPAAGDFTEIAATGTQTLWAPAITADGLAFYYVVLNDPSASVNGIHESLRASTSVPFPKGTRMPALVQSIAQYVNGLSTDRLAIFLEENAVFAAVVLTRASLADPFTNPLAPNPPPAVPGLRTRPLAGCKELIGTCSPVGGCSNERVCTWGP